VRTVFTARTLPSDLVDLWKSFCRADRLYHSPFYWPQFTQAVDHARSDVRIAVYERNGDVVGFLPFHLTRGGAGKPVGGQLNDYQGPILAPGCHLAPHELLEGAGISSYDFNHLPIAMSSLAADATSYSSSPQMDLSEGYDAFVGRKGSNWTKAKREIRRRYRKTEEDVGPIRFNIHDPSDDTFDQHFRLKNALLERAGTRFRVRADWIGAVLDALRHFDEPEFRSRMTTIHAGDRLMAAHFGLMSHDIWHWWFPSYDLEFYKLGPGINLVDQCAMAAPGEGIATIDFGRGDGAFKLLFADRQVALCEGTISRAGSMARIVRQGADRLVGAAERLPLGRYRSYPRRLAARLVSGVALSGPPRFAPDRTCS
jgi:CelD/BcsL family acetyltransferase involved in cellulose biosynthesis